MKRLLYITDNKDKYILNNENNIKCMSFRELLKEYYFDYDCKALYYLVNKLNIKLDLAKIYLNNIMYVRDINDIKIKKLNEIKKILLDNNLLIINPLFKSNLKKFKVVFEDRCYSLFEKKVIDEISNITEVEISSKEMTEYNNVIYSLENPEEEVIFIFNEICKLLKNGIDINNIYITNLDNSYRILFNKYSYIYNVPVNLNYSNTIYSTRLVNEFINNYNCDIESTFDKISSLVNNDIDQMIYNKLIDICNKYVFVDDYLLVKELIIDEIKNTNKDNIKLKNAVNEIDFNSFISNDNNYLFLVSMNQNSFPKIKKDEDYLSDKLKSMLGLMTSEEINKNNLDIYSKMVKRCKNLILTSKKYEDSGQSYLSSINDILKYDVIDIVNEVYVNSNFYNNLKLADMYDDYYKYGTIPKYFNVLASNYKDNYYLKYNNSYKKIDSNMIKEFLDNKVYLSYSSLDVYKRCNFRFYLNNVLKLNDYEETFMLFIGNVYHSVLEKAFEDSFDFDSYFNELISERNLTSKEKFFINKLRDELLFVIKTINEQNIYSSYENELYETKIEVEYGNNIFSGVIDKIKYSDDSLAIIDYKTGSPNINLNNVLYGIGMQLPIYLYLVRHHEKFKNMRISGFYLQQVLNSDGLLGCNDVLDTVKKKNLMLQGYSNSDESLLEKLDSGYSDSKIIRSLKLSSKGFYSYSKVIDDNHINKIINIIEKEIVGGFDDILNGSFSINPKKIGINNEGCKYCKYSDICFRKEKDILEVKEYKNLEFLDE